LIGPRQKKPDVRFLGRRPIRRFQVGGRTGYIVHPQA
jgi:hypothetical protein